MFGDRESPIASDLAGELNRELMFASSAKMLPLCRTALRTPALQLARRSMSVKFSKVRLRSRGSGCRYWTAATAVAFLRRPLATLA